MNFAPFKGAALLATGRGRGINYFTATEGAFLASLAPLIAFPLVGAGKMLLSGQPLGALGALLLTLVAQLTPPVVSHALATRWGRELEWIRYATAFNWCQWAIPVVLFVMVIVFQLAAGSRFSEEQAAKVVVLGIGAYGLWLHWMVARHGLILSRRRAALLVLLVGLATVALLMGPHLLQLIIS
jgi:hypothetical protein